MKRFILMIVLLCPAILILQAQNEDDALRYSNTYLTGTARYMGLGGAYGAIGADFTSLSSNPAGIGIYKKSEFTITPSLFFANSESTYNGRTLTDNRNNFALGNVGIILALEPEDRLDRIPVKNFQFGFGLNRLNDFNNRMRIEGENDKNSILDTYVDYSNNLNPQSLNPFDTRLAFDTYLIDTIQGLSDFVYMQAYDYIGGFSKALQRKSVETWGSMNEWVMAGGMNLSERFYFGASVGFPYIRYFRNDNYSETNLNTPKDLTEFNVYEHLETKGSGVNFKIGTIAKVMPWLRLGFAYNSPSWYNNMNDRWYSRMNAYYDNGDYYAASSPDGDYDYRLQTPWKLIGSAAVIFGKNGLLSAEYEYIDYSKARLNASDYGFWDENDQIENSYRNTQNLRFGAEWRLGLIQLRGGYANYGSPFKSGINDGVRQIFSGGLGFRSKEFYIDAGFAYNISKSDYYLYGSETVSVNPAKNEFKSYNLLFTLGYRFE